MQFDVMYVCNQVVVLKNLVAPARTYLRFNRVCVHMSMHTGLMCDRKIFTFGCSTVVTSPVTFAHAAISQRPGVDACATVLAWRAIAVIDVCMGGPTEGCTHNRARPKPNATTITLKSNGTGILKQWNVYPEIKLADDTGFDGAKPPL